MTDDPHRALQGKIRDVIAAEPTVAAAYLYGSAARSQATPLSDVDVALVPSDGLADEERGRLLRHLLVELERAAPGSRFDVRWLDELPTAIRGRAVTDGVLVHERDPAARVAAEVRARMLYHDFLYFERQGTEEGLRELRRSFRDG